jgi:single-strand DNA-binding protein
MGVNSVVLVGRLTRDPDHTYTPQGISVCNMGLAVDRMTKRDDGSYETDFFNVTAWRHAADFAAKYLQKGRLVCVEGRIQIREYIDQNSGAKKKVTEIVAERLQGLDKPSGNTQASKPGNVSDHGAEHHDLDPCAGPDPFADE